MTISYIYITYLKRIVFNIHYISYAIYRFTDIYKFIDFIK